MALIVGSGAGLYRVGYVIVGCASSPLAGTPRPSLHREAEPRSGLFYCLRGITAQTTGVIFRRLMSYGVLMLAAVSHDS